MTPKKNWPLNNCEDLRNKSGCNISWSSSSPEDDFDYSIRKKIKNNNFRTASLPKTWIKVRHLSQSSSHNKNECETIIDNIINESSVSICSQFTSEVQSQNSRCKPSLSSNHSFEESPIIGHLKFEELSPVLGWRKDNELLNSSSPTIGRNQMKLRAKKSSKNEESKFKSTCIYSTQQSDTVIESDSPKSQTSQRAIICSGQSSHSPSNLIDSFSSQQCTEVIFNTDSTESLTSKSSAEPLYHEVPPKKKKRYKKNGLAYQLQKALHKQKTDFAICRHELYLNKSKGYEVSSPYDDNAVLLLKILNIRREFGVTIVECEYVEDKSEVSKRNCKLLSIQESYVSDLNQTMAHSSSVCKNRFNLKECLVIIGFNVTHSIRLKINSRLKLHPPYITKTITCNGELKVCYCNVSKLFSFK